MSYKKYSRAEKEEICILVNEGYSAKELVDKLSIPITNIYRWYSFYNSGVPLESGKSSGRKGLLTPEEEVKMIEKLEENPELSNIQLALIVNNKIAFNTITHYLLWQDPPFTRKASLDEEPIDDNKAIELEKKYLNNISSD